MVLKFWNWLTKPYRRWKEEKRFKKRLKELHDKDPFIYK
jgi:hypothetical protein